MEGKNFEQFDEEVAREMDEAIKDITQGGDPQDHVDHLEKIEEEFN